jgi:hypothetical protein
MSSVFVIIFVELQRVDCSLVVNADENRCVWGCDGGEGVDRFLDSV